MKCCTSLLLCIFFAIFVTRASGQVLPADTARPQVNTVENNSQQAVDDGEKVAHRKLRPVREEASFPGGLRAWREYIQTALLSKMKFLFRHEAWGSAEVGFTVKSDGAIANIKIIQSSGTDLDKVIIDMLKKCPHWLPAIRDNHPIDAFRLQKFSVPSPND